MKGSFIFLSIVSLCLISYLFLFSTNTIKTTLPNLQESKFDFNSFPDSLVHSGDLIFRDGRGFISSAFRRLSLKDPRYSHAGIIHKENGKIYVYHVIGGEDNKNNTMHKDLLNDFCSPIQANAFGIYRSDQSASRIDSMAGNYFLQKLKFDARFDLSTDDKMYCTEFIYKILEKVSGQNNFLPLTILSGKKYVSCDNIYLSSHTQKIYSINYSFKQKNYEK